MQEYSTIKMHEVMQAVTFKYSSREAQLVEVKAPELNKEEILVKIIYAALDPALDTAVNKTMVGGLLHKFTTPLFCGYNFRGTIEKLGDNISNADFPVGCDVFGHVPYHTSHNTQGTLAQYVVIKADECALMPKGVNVETAAITATEVSPALQATRDKSGIEEKKQTPQSVLINGAGGVVGLAAVQIAKRKGANITAICSTKDVEKVKNLGADVIIDRKKVSNAFSSLRKKQFDIIFDTPAAFPAVTSLAYLKPKGRMVFTKMRYRHFVEAVRFTFSRESYTMIIIKSKKADLKTIGRWLEDGFKVDCDIEYKGTRTDKLVFKIRKG